MGRETKAYNAAQWIEKQRIWTAKGGSESCTAYQVSGSKTLKQCSQYLGGSRCVGGNEADEDRDHHSRQHLYKSQTTVVKQMALRNLSVREGLFVNVMQSRAIL